MKTAAFLLVSGLLFSTAYAQTTPAKKVAVAHLDTTTKGKAVGRTFIKKSKPADALFERR